MNVGDITIQLTLDGKDMTLQLKEAGSLLRQFRGNVEDTAKSVKRLEDSQFSLGTKFRNLVLTLGNLRFAAMDLYDVFLRLPASILKSSGELERLQQQLAGLSNEMTDSARQIEASQNFDYVINTAKNAPFAVNAIAESFVKLRTAGIDPTQGSMQALVDSVAKFGGNNESLKRASVAIQQMAGKGVISMEELRQQLGEAIPDAMQNMAIGMGLSMAELTKLVSKGVVEAGSAIDKMTTIMAIRNRGAAEDMMKTWVGAVSQIETEWLLASKTIAEGGFADEMKKVVRELITVMRSDEFQGFAKNFGAGLGEVVRDIAKGVKVLVEYRSEIMLLVQAFLVYKAATSFLKPGLEALVGGVQAVTGAWAQQRRQLEASAQIESQLSQAAIKRRADEAVAAQAAANAAIAAKQREVASIKAANAQLYADYVRMTAASKIQEIKPGIFQLGDPTLVPKIRAVGDEISKNNTKIREASLAMDAQARAHAAAGVAAAAHAAELNTLAAANTRVSVATTAASGALRAGQFIWAAVGGWIGVVTVALTLGAMWWFNYAKRAEEAIDRVDRARQKLSTKEDVKELANSLTDARGELELLKKAEDQLKKNRDNASDPTFKANIDRQLAINANAQKAASAEIQKIQDTLSQAQQAVTERTAKANAQAILDQAQIELDAINKTGKDKRSMVEKVYEDEIKAAGKNEAKQKAARDARLKGIRESEEEQLRKESGTLGRLRSSLVARSATDPAAKEALKGLDSLFEGVKDRGAALGRLDTEINLLVSDKDKKPKAPKEDRIKTFVENLGESMVELEAQIPGLIQNSQALDVGLAAFEKVIARWQNGDFRNTDGTQPSEEDIFVAANIARDEANLKQAIDVYRKMADDVRQTRPEVTEALTYLANPLPNRVETSNFDAFTKRLAGMGLSVEEIARRLKRSVPEVQAAITEGGLQATILDLSKATEKVTKDLENSGLMNETQRKEHAVRLVNIERDTNIKLAELALERAAVLDAGEQRDQIEKAARQLIERSRLLAENKTAVLTQTPMEKMLSDWRDTTTQMNNATADWGRQVVDTFVNSARTGKLEWKGLVNSVLEGILQIAAQKALSSAVEAGGSWLTTIVSSFFANGGIMSSAGSVPLKKYARGGIANSPQMAVFGEGDNPEAYVPLPDGRSIPVTMSGAAGGETSVVINVINQTSQAVNATKSAPRMDGKQMVLDVVLSAAGQPGPFRDGMRAMMGS